MKQIDYTAIDGQLLRTFLTILEELSVTRAAVRLGVTQSTVSHALARLRVFFDDPLFVRSGQALMPTEHAINLKVPVQEVLDGLQGLTHKREFDPRKEDLFFIIAANDIQRDTIFPELLRQLRDEDISIAFEFIPSGHPTIGMMRDARCHLALTPFPPDATDIMQKTVLYGKMMCFFDGSVRDAPKSWDEYCQADHLAVRFPDGGTSLRALTGVDKSKIREARVSVSNFNGIPPFLKGTNMIATELNLLKLVVFDSIEMAPLPFKSDPLSIYMTWHQRSTSDPAHVWLRGRIEAIAANVMEASKPQA
ncbi:MAG: LysR family transcriptional regulator [Rhizobiaceae bacterium]